MLLPALLMFGCVPDETASSASSGEDWIVLAPTGAGLYADELDRLDWDIAAAQDRAADLPSSWTARSQLSVLWQQRARLSGDYGDYAEADAEMAEAFAIAPEGAGPFLARARLSHTLHRFPDVAADLDAAASAIIVDDPTQSALDTARGNLAWQQGDYDGAVALVASATALDASTASVAAAAHFDWRFADFSTAEARFDDAAAMYVGTAAEPRAWVHLQRGLMDLERGRHDDALAHYLDAEAALPGYWLVHEHIAEILVLQGRTDQARAIYDAVIADTDGPEFMDALAELELEAGNLDAAEGWIDAARQRYERDLARFPEAAAGHALGHFLTFGPTDRAITLAEDNLALRDNAESRMWAAQALLADGDPDGAVVHIEVALDTPWTTAELHATAASVYAALGEDTAARAQEDAARALDPTSLD